MRPVAKILGTRPGVLNLHLATDVSRPSPTTSRMTMLYKIESGPALEKNYGLHLARAMGFPEDFIQVAENVSKTLTESMERKKDESQSRKLIRQRKLILNLAESLKQFQSSGMDDAALGSYLRHLQNEFVLRMDSLDADIKEEAKV
jgi:DNA mismatch repair protein MSH4